MISDATLGRGTLVCSVCVFALLVLWIDIYPFVEAESVPSPESALVCVSVWGGILVLLLSLYTCMQYGQH